MSRPVEPDDLTGIKIRLDEVRYELNLIRLLAEVQLPKEKADTSILAISKDRDLQTYYEKPPT